MISYIVNPENNPINTRTVKGENFYVSRAGELEGQETVFESNKSTRLDYLEFSSDHSQAQILIQYYNGTSYESIGTIRPDGTGTAGTRLEWIVAYGNSLFDINVYNTSTNEYKVSLSRPLFFSKGLKIVLINNSSESKNLACRAFGVTNV